MISREAGYRAARRAAAVAVALVFTAVVVSAGFATVARAAVAARQAAGSALLTTGPLPPELVRPVVGARGALNPVEVTEGVVLDVPAYLWRDGCAPTSAGMVVGYWDGKRFPGLVPGDASSETTAALQMIASHGSAAQRGHYEDYAQPLDSGRGIIDDRSEDPSGDEHANDSLADFMHTSFSVDGLAWGWSYTSMVGPALVAYVEQAVGEAAPMYQDLGYGPSGLSFDRLRQEIDAGRPVVLYVDSNGDGVTDHAVAGIGYGEFSAEPAYAFLDTWKYAVHWELFRGKSSEYAWGLGGGTAFSPEAVEWPVSDLSPPVTSVDGAGGGWSRGPVDVTFLATDSGLGVDFTEAGIDGAGLSRLSGTPATLRVAGQGEHTVRYRSTDKAGRVEDIRTCTVRIDGEGPVTSVRPARARRAARVTLRYRVADVTPRAAVRLLVKTRSGRTRAALKLGWRGTGTVRSLRWSCTLRRGTYRLVVLATDQAGNRQSKAGSARLIVR